MTTDRAPLLADLAAGADAAASTDPRAAAIGERLRAAFEAGCRKHDIHAELVGPPQRMDVRFSGQEDVSGELIGQVFVEELATRGVRAGPVLAPSPALDEATVARLEAVLRDVLNRLRTLLIEANSYLSGGLRWPFPDGGAFLRERGLAVYRFPKRGPVDVSAIDDHMRIAFAPGPLGEVTSSGFYVPTKIRGDFDVTLRYRVRRWQPGPVAACLALFAQDEPSLQRYYAQIRSAANQERHAMANLCEQLSAPVPATADDGAFRLTRNGQRVVAYHRANDTDAWTRLGERADFAAADMVIGSKIWSSDRCDGLVADLYELRIEAEIPTDNLGPVPVRPDPR